MCPAGFMVFVEVHNYLFGETVAPMQSLFILFILNYFCNADALANEGYGENSESLSSSQQSHDYQLSQQSNMLDVSLDTT